MVVWAGYIICWCVRCLHGLVLMLQCLVGLLDCAGCWFSSCVLFLCLNCGLVVFY